MRRPTNLVAVFLESRRAKGCTDGTLAAYRVHLEQYHSHTDRINSRSVSSYLADLRTRAKPGYAWTQARTLRTYVRWLHSMGYLRKPVQVEMPRNPFQMGRVLSPDEVRRILTVADLRELAIIMLLLDTGLRRSEACSLTWAGLEDHTIRLRTGKGGHGRIVFIGDHTSAALEAIRSDGPILGLIPEGLRTMLNRLSRRSGVPQVTCHAFRRSFATSMIRAGVPLLHVHGMMGHRTLAMIPRYAQVSGDDLAESHKLAGVVDRL